VNQDGQRLRGFEINTLTVIATERYEQFAENLQKEIEEDTAFALASWRRTSSPPSRPPAQTARTRRWVRAVEGPVEHLKARGTSTRGAMCRTHSGKRSGQHADRARALHRTA